MSGSEELKQKRKQIRHAVVELLCNRTAAGDRVYANRVRSLFPAQDPTLLIYTLEENVSITSIGPTKRKRRVLRLAIEARAEATDALDDLLDDLLNEVEAIMDANTTLNETAQNNSLTEAIFDISPSGDTLIGAGRLTYDVIYFN